MNKNRYRIIFNRVRHLYMVVAESVKSHVAGSGTTASACVLAKDPKQSYSQVLHLRPLAFSLLIALDLVSVIGISSYTTFAYADIIADPSAPKSQQPIILNAPNGVPLVNIQTPSAAGVSRNTYRQFDVNSNGAILNNSRTNTQTQLGGWIQGNPYLATGTARIILNEVNSSNPSYLNGYVEVAGSRAQVVIANPAGISCSGCGFINASRATLTTGTPVMNSGDLMGYRVGGGAIDFLGAGLDTANSNYTDVIARAVNVNAGLWAQNLNVITGSNQVNVASNGDVTGITTISPNATLPNGSSNPTPSFALDVAALGGMYAGKIHLIGTEAGLGVSNAGNIGASAGEISIDVNGNLTNSHRISSTTQTNINAASISNTGGTLSAGQLLNINANSLTGDGQLLSGGDATVTLSSDYTQTNTGKIQANGNLTFTTTGNLTNQSSILAGNTLTLNAANIDNTVTAEITGFNTHINANSTLTNRGLIDGGDTFINADILNNIGTGSIFGDHIALSATTLNNDTETVNGVTTAAVIAARNQLNIGATTITNRENALIFSAGNLAIGGALDTSHHATGQASILNNTGATIEALGNVNLNVATINNTNAHLITQYVRTSVASTLAASVDVRGNMGSPAPEAGNTRQYQLSYFSTDGALLFGRVYNYDEVDHFYLDGSGFVHLVLKAGIANDGMTDANTFMQFNSGSIVYETQTLSTQPGQILSGGNMQINANSVLNNDSKMIAGGTFNANVVTLNNQETLGTRSSQYGSESAFFRTRESCDCSRYFQYPNYPAPVTTSINLGNTAYGAVSTVTGSGTTVATLSHNNIPSNSLFTPTANTSAHYLIETNPRFANYRSWLSSDYMLNALNLDPALMQKRLGDGFYEQKLIREQIAQLTGRRFLAGYSNDEEEYQALMTNGATFAQQYQLIPGVALTETQIAQLTSDIVWLVEQTVTLPDGTQTQALVPQVYARLQAGDLSPTGSLIAGQTLNLNVSGNVINGGDLAGRDALYLNADNIHNINGRIRAINTQLDASNDINNLGGQIIAQDSMMLNANNINIESTTASSTLAFDLDQGNRIIHVDNKRTNIDRVAGLYVTNPSGTGLLVASAGNNLHLDGAEIVNLASHVSDNANSGQTLLKAGNDISLGIVTTTQNNSYVQNAKNYNKDSNNLEVGSTIQTAGDITLLAGQNLNIKAADISSENGKLTGVAGNDISITAGTNTYDTASASYKKSSGFMSSKSKTTRDTSHDTEVVSSNLSADSVDLNAGHDLAVTGSNIVGTNDVNLNAQNNVTLDTAQATHDETHYKKTKQSGLMSSGGVGVTIGSSKLTNTNDSQQVTNVGSTVGSVQGDVKISSGNTYTQMGSDLLTPQGDIDITAQQVDITNATDTYANQQTMKYKQSGLTLAITSPVISAIQTVSQMSEAAGKTSDPRLQALAAGTAALAANNAKDAIIAGNTPQLDENGLQVLDANGKNTAENPANQVGGVNLSLSIGSSKSSSQTVQTNTTVKSSTVNAGGDVTITATGDGSNNPDTGNINVIGSTIKAADNVTLKADDKINLLAAQNVDTLNSKNKGSSASLGISIGSDGLLVTASASGSKGKTKGNGSTWTETQVQGGNNTGDTVTLNSGTDTTLKGAQVTGNQVVADVGTSGQGNLNIQSLQDTNQYKDKQQSIGGSISVGYGVVGGSISYSDSKTKSNYQSVNEQSGIMAGDGGFQVNVNGNTDLKGAVIASTDKAIQDNKNSLTTQTLTTSNIENKADYKASSTSFGGGYSASGANVGFGSPNATDSSAGSPNMVGTDQQGQATTGGAAIPNTSLPSLGGYSATLPSTLKASDKAESTTVSGISGGSINITQSSAQRTLTGRDADTTVALLNRDVQTQQSVDAQGNVTAIAVDGQGNNLASTIAPIFTEEKKAEIEAGFEITRAFTQQVGTFLSNRAKESTDAQKTIDAENKAAEAEGRAPDYMLLSQQQQILDNNATWSMGGTGRIALTAVTAAFSGNVTGSSTTLIQSATVATLQSLSAQQIKAIADQVGGEGSAAHTALHAVLACAGAAATGGDCGTGALAVSSGVVINKLLDGIEGTNSNNLTASEKEARLNLITTIVTGITAAAGGDAAVANAAVTIETENNALSPTQVAYYHAEALKCKDDLCIQRVQDSARLQSKDKDLSLSFDKILCAISDVCRPKISNETEIKAMFSSEGVDNLVNAVKSLHPDWTEERIALQSIAYINEAMNSFDQSTLRTVVGALDLVNAVAAALPAVSLPTSMLAYDAQSLRAIVKDSTTLYAPNVFNIKSESDLLSLFNNMTWGAKDGISKDLNGVTKILPDGTRVMLRNESKSGLGKTIEVKPVTGKKYKIHIGANELE